MMMQYHVASCSYTYLQTLSREELHAVAEEVPDGPSTKELVRIAKEHDIVVMAGLVEREGAFMYNTYICVGPRQVAVRLSAYKLSLLYEVIRKYCAVAS